MLQFQKKIQCLLLFQSHLLFAGYFLDQVVAVFPGEEMPLIRRVRNHFENFHLFFLLDEILTNSLNEFTPVNGLPREETIDEVMWFFEKKRLLFVKLELG